MKFVNKKAQSLGNNAMKIVYGFLGIVLLLLLSAELLPEVMDATTAVGNISNLPLSGLFTGGVIVMIIVVALIVGVIKGAGKINK